MKILFVASECTPFIKTGGLADVVGTLPCELAKGGDEVSVIIPKYSRIPNELCERMEHVTDFHISLGWRRQYVGIDRLIESGVTWYFADNEYYFKQDYVYSSGDFETERFCWFGLAVAEAMTRLEQIPDVLHLNDWQTGLIPLIKQKHFAHIEKWRNARTVFTIHNLRYQGYMNPLLVNDLLWLGQSALEGIEHYTSANAMKAGILHSDIITTVSPTYASEIMTPDYGETLDALLCSRRSDLHGILNGIDVISYNPWTDKQIPARFSANSLSGKAKCKAQLQRELGLSQDAAAPLMCVISRLTPQKGVDLIERTIPLLLSLGAQLAVLGMGDTGYEQLFDALGKQHPGRIAFRCEMNDCLARRMYAGGDMFIMPSAFEPCGISQMLAQRYACIPIVRETGGLNDTVTPYNKFTDEGDGFSFKNYSSSELGDACSRAIDLFITNPTAWQHLMHRCAALDNSWEKSAKAYLALYRSLLQGR